MKIDHNAVVTEFFVHQIYQMEHLIPDKKSINNWHANSILTTERLFFLLLLGDDSSVGFELRSPSKAVPNLATGAEFVTASAID